MFFTTLLLAEYTPSEPTLLPRRDGIFVGLDQEAEVYLEVELMPDDRDVSELHFVIGIQDESSPDAEVGWLVAERVIPVPAHRAHPIHRTLRVPVRLEFPRPGGYRLVAYAGQQGSAAYHRAPWKWLLVQ